MPKRTNVYPNEHLTFLYKGDKLFYSKKMWKMHTIVNRLGVDIKRIMLIHRTTPAYRPPLLKRLQGNIADARPNPPALRPDSPFGRAFQGGIPSIKILYVLRFFIITSTYYRISTFPNFQIVSFPNSSYH